MILALQPYFAAHHKDHSGKKATGNNNGSSWLKVDLLRVSKYCAYCGSKFTKDRGRSSDNFPSFDHIRPDSAWGERDTHNGLLVCSPCNTLRRNVPLMEFLQGDHFFYGYSDNGNKVERGVAFSPSLKAIQNGSFRASMPSTQKRLVSFSQYMERAVTSSSGWFSKDSFDRILYPFWKLGKCPVDTTAAKGLYQERVTSFLGLLARVNPQFWLSRDFEKMAYKKFGLSQDQRQALRNSIRILRREPLEEVA